MYLYKIPSENHPEWFKERVAKVLSGDSWRPFGGDRSWIWKWNDTYERKISIRNGAVNIVFDDEADYMWFILSEL